MRYVIVGEYMLCRSFSPLGARLLGDLSERLACGPLAGWSPPLPVGVLDAERKALLLPHRTLVTRIPQEFEDDVPVLEYSLIDATGVTSDDATLADMISHAWTKFRLKSEGWFILRLLQDGDHEIQFPE
jgi:hypothetical protein